jgi:hypothetical protein
VPTLQEISEQGAAAAEQMVRECIEMDYAFETGNLQEWIDRKYARVKEETYGNGNPGPADNGGTTAGPNP